MLNEHTLRRCFVAKDFQVLRRTGCSKAFVTCMAIMVAAPISADAQQPGTPAYNSVVLPGHGAGDTRQRGRDNWGAVSFARGVPSSPVTGMRTRREAEERALALCRGLGGGKRCDVTSFSNGCMAFAESEMRIGSRVDHPRHTSAEYRREQALKSCGEADCRITWEGCAFD